MPYTGWKGAVSLEERITELEIMVAHQDDTIRTLNEEIIRQGRVIDGLAKRMETVDRMLKQFTEPGPSAPEDEPPPPHY